MVSCEAKSHLNQDQESVLSDSQRKTEEQETGVIQRELSKLEIKEETEGDANQVGKEEDKKGEEGGVR